MYGDGWLDRTVDQDQEKDVGEGHRGQRHADQADRILE